MSEEKITPAANVLGTIGTVLWCIQLIPQIVHNYRKKNCEGLPPLMMFLWAVSGIPFAIYFVVQHSNIPVQVQPHVFTFFALVTLWQTLVYPPRAYSWVKVSLAMAVLVAVLAGIEAGCIVPFEPLYERGITWPTLLVGIIAAVLLAAGLLPPYFELWKRGGQVVGINFIFLTIDTLGAVFSLFSLVAQKGSLDVLGCVLYIIVAVLELGIFASHSIWLLRTRKQRREEREAQKAMEENENESVSEKFDTDCHDNKDSVVIEEV